MSFGTYVANKKFFTSLLLIVLSLSLVLAGCGNGGGTDSSNTDTASGANGTGDTTTNEERIVKHAMGETPVKSTDRVVILTNEGTEALLALGVKPVGAVKSWTGDPWYDHIEAEMEGVTPVGTESEVSLEAIAALKPDLIIGNKMRQEKIYSQLEAIAPTVFSDTLRGEWMINFAFYAEALDKKAEGDKILADFDARIKAFQEKAGDKLSTKVSVVRFMAGKTRIYWKNSFSGVILEQIGLARPNITLADDFAEEITKERIPEMDGDIMFYFTYDTGDGKATATEEEWINDPLFQNLDVVKNNKYFKVNDTIWNTAGGVKAANLMLDDLDKLFFEAIK